MSNPTLEPGDEARTAGSPTARDLDLDRVREAVRGIRYGEVRVIIQDGHVVQIERVEKHRLR